MTCEVEGTLDKEVIDWAGRVMLGSALLDGPKEPAVGAAVVVEATTFLVAGP